VADVAGVTAGLAGAGDVPGLLAAGWDAFEFARAAAEAAAEGLPEDYAALMFAAAAAAAGRDAVGFAPSMPAGPAPGPDGPGPGAGVAADAIAALAAGLAGWMLTGARQAVLAGDRAAFEQAAREAGSVRDLLSGGGP
jgi:hypothetical protein